MNVLLLGAGGREHALAWKLKQSPLLTRLYSWPRHPVIAKMTEPLPASSDCDWSDLANIAKECSIDLLIVGPEKPLAEGVADVFQSYGIAVFGPTRFAAQIESSKAFAKLMMKKAGIPTAAFSICDDLETARQQAIDWLNRPSGGVVVKASGLAAGKGVFVCRSLEEVEQAFEYLSQESFAAARSQIVLEEVLKGRECSFFAFLGLGDPEVLGFAVDFKRLENEDKGPNTGGMGCYSPVPWLPDSAADEISKLIVEPLIGAFRSVGIEYIGCLYVGIMWTKSGPKVVEFNCRLGDPEAQILALSDNTDWLDMMARKAGVHVKPEYRPSSHIGYHVVGIVAASSGYPFDKDEDFKFQIPRSALFGLSDVPGKNADEGAFAASVEETDEGEVYTSSGRVLCVVARAGCFSEARSRAYKKIEELTSGWNGVRYRSDIAKYVVSESS